jgi:hypothetical protein
MGNAEGIWATRDTYENKLLVMKRKEKKSYTCTQAPDINMNFMKAGYEGVSIEW